MTFQPLSPVSINTNPDFDTVLISDLHLGSNLSQVHELHEFLDTIKTRNLILVGDIFDDLNFKRLKDSHWRVLKKFRKMSKHINVVWVRGNHDLIPANFLSHLLGVEVKTAYQWSYNDHRFYAVHGDRWDEFIYKYKRITKMATWLFIMFQNHFPNASYAYSRTIKKYSKKLIRNVEAVRNMAIEYAHQRGFKAIFCGHTHFPELLRDETGLVIYGNDGTWQTDVPHYIGILGNEIRLYRYEYGTSHLVKREFIDAMEDVLQPAISGHPLPAVVQSPSPVTP